LPSATAFEDLEEVRAIEGSHTGDHFIENGTEGKNIRLGTYILRIADLFGRHVLGSAHGGASASRCGTAFFADDLGQTEIGDLWRKARIGDFENNVGWLEVAVDQVALVSFGHGRHDFLGQLIDLGEVETLSGNQGLECGAVDKLHYEPGRAIYIYYICHGDDIAVIELGLNPTFLEQALLNGW
jgi:hypothetical protein